MRQFDPIFDDFMGDDDEDEDDMLFKNRPVAPMIGSLKQIDTTLQDIAPYRATLELQTRGDNWWLE